MSHSLPRALLSALMITIPAALICLLLSALLLTSLADPIPFIPPIAIALLLCFSALTGFLTVRSHKQSGLLCGALGGAGFSVPPLLIGMILGSASPALSFVLWIIAAFLSSLAGYLALPRTSASHLKKAMLQRAR